MNMPNLASCHHFMRRCWSGVGASPEGSRPGGGWAAAGLAASIAGAVAAASISPRRSTEKSGMAPSQRRGSGARVGGIKSAHVHGGQVKIQNRLLLLEIRLVELSHADHLAHDLGLEPSPFGLAIDFADVGGQGRALFFQPLDAIDEGLELV